MVKMLERSPLEKLWGTWRDPLNCCFWKELCGAMGWFPLFSKKVYLGSLPRLGEGRER